MGVLSGAFENAKEVVRSLPVVPTAFASVATVGFGIFVYLRLEKSNCIPRNFVQRKPLRDDEMPKHAGEIHRDVYSRKKLPKNVDVIIIGSGISGLTLGALLARCGRRVLVLEQHYIAGGATHTFEEKGYEFDTGALWRDGCPLCWICAAFQCTAGFRHFTLAVCVSTI